MGPSNSTEDLLAIAIVICTLVVFGTVLPMKRPYVFTFTYQECGCLVLWRLRPIHMVMVSDKVKMNLLR